MLELFAYSEMRRASEAVSEAFRNENSTHEQISIVIDELRNARDKVLSVQKPENFERTHEIIAIMSAAVQSQKKSEQLINGYFEQLHSILRLQFQNYVETLKLDSDFHLYDILPNLEANTVKIILELNLPLTWNFERDLFVTTASNHVLIDLMQKKGQQRILVLGQVDKDKNTDVNYVEKESEIYRSLLDYGFYPPRQTFTFGVKEETYGAIKDRVHQTVEAMNVYSNTSNKYSKTWVENEIKNISQIVNSNCVSSLKDSFRGKNIIVVSPGPSLKNDLKKLREIHRNFIIIAPLQSLPALINARISPDYITCIDPEDFSKYIDLDLTKKSRGLIISESCHPNVMSTNIAKYILFTPKQVLNLHSLINGEIKHMFGASVSIISVDLARDLGASSVTLLGQDLVLSNETYCGLPQDYNKTVIKEKTILWKGNEVPLKFLKGKDNKIYHTRPDFFNFHFEFEYFASQVKNDLKLFNATSVGAEIKGFENINLAELERKLNRNKKQLMTDEKWEKSNKADKKDIYDHLMKKIGKMQEIETNSLKIIGIINQHDGRKLEKIDILEKKLIELIKDEWILSLYLKSFLSIFLSQASISKDLYTNLQLTNELHNKIVEISSTIRSLIEKEKEKIH